MPRHLLLVPVALLPLAACMTVPPEDLEAASETTAAEPAATTAYETWPSVMTTTEREPGDSSGADTADGGPCEPGTREFCPYGGPDGTLGVGACAAATRLCDEEGRWSACSGEVLPRAEDCRTKLDENCDGLDSCDGGVVWARSFGEAPGEPAGSAAVGAVTVDPTGRAWLTGQFTRSLRWGARDWSTDGKGGYLLARIDRSGEPGYSVADEQPGALALGAAATSDPTGRIAFAAGYTDRLKVHPDAPLYQTSEITGAAVVGAVDMDGEYRWSRSLIPTGFADVALTGLAFDGAGDLWIGGHLGFGAIDLETDGAPMKVGNAGGYDALLLRVNRRGDFTWVGNFGDWRDQQIHDVAVDPFGDVWLVGAFDGTMNFDGGSVQSAVSEGAQEDMFVVKLDAHGEFRWGRVYGDESDQRLLRVAIDAAGNGHVFGEYAGTIEGLADAPLVATDTNLVAAKLDPDGVVVWVKDWPCEGTCDLESAALDPAGQSIVSASVQPGSTLMTNARKISVAGPQALGVAVKLDRAGYALWAAAPLPATSELAAGPLGEVFVAGDFYEHATIADETHQLEAGAGDRDLYVAMLRP